MNRSDFLKCIAETGYNVGFGAKKHFATYDLVEKSPGWISFISIAFGIYSLAFKELSTSFLTAWTACPNSFHTESIASSVISLLCSNNSFLRNGVSISDVADIVFLSYTPS